MVRHSAEKFADSGGNTSSYSDSELICTAGKKGDKSRYRRAWIWEGTDRTWYSPIDYVSKHKPGLWKNNDRLSNLKYPSFFSGPVSHQNGKGGFQGMIKERRRSSEVMESMAQPLQRDKDVERRHGSLLFALSNEAMVEASRLGRENMNVERDRLNVQGTDVNSAGICYRKCSKRGRINTRYDRLSEEQKAGLEFLAEVAEKELKRIRDEKVTYSYRRIVDEGDKENQEFSSGSTFMGRNPSRNRSIYAKEAGSESIKNFSDLNDQIFMTIETSGGYEYICPKKGCGKTFPSLSRIKRHYIIHTGAKPFVCLNSQCPKRFSRKDNMLQHYKTHCKFS